MNIGEMHYDFKQKLNKIDSEQNRNLRIPEIDWKLNEGIDVFIKMVAEPRTYNQFGFETNQRIIDDIRTIVINNLSLIVSKVETGIYKAELPNNYMFYISGHAKIKRNNCPTQWGRLLIRQHDDRFKESPFDKSSYEWREINAVFYENGLQIYTDGTFEIEEIKIDYIRKHAYVHNAQNFLPSGSYKLPSGIVLTGTQDCELPEHTHREIVDIAVLIASGDLSLADYQLKQNKLSINNN